MPGAVAEADREIEAVAGKIDAVIVGQDAQVDRRMAGGEIGHARQQPAGREGADHADRDDLAEAAVGEKIEHRPDPVERLAEHRHQSRAFVGQGEAARQPANRRAPSRASSSLI